MSSRILKFEDNILILWSEIEELVKGIDVTGLSTEERDEIAHLKKVVAYFSDMLQFIDPDFVPLRVLDSVKSPISNIQKSLINYTNTGNFQYIKNINSDHLDTLLKDLMPFIFYKGKAGYALNNALKSYSNVISEHSQSYLSDIEVNYNQAKNHLDKIKDIENNAYKNNEKILAYSETLFGEDGLEEKLIKLAEDFDRQSIEISKFYEDLTTEEGFIDRIKNYLEDSKIKNKEINSLKDNSIQTIDELEEFHTEIFGTENDEGEREGGLKNELAFRRKELDEFKKTQQDRYKELNTQIENLLPGATSAGLSSAYNQLHEQFNQEVKSYGRWFYRALGILLLVVFAVTVTPYVLNKFDNSTSMSVTVQTAENSAENHKKTNENIEVKHINKTDLVLNDTNNEISISNRLISLLDNFIYKFPFILPALWLVLFISKRRKEAQRLAQEYAHKEALAKSYESYKQQIEKLDEEDKNKLLPILMENMLKAIALNPAETLDRHANNETPMEEIIKKKEFWDLIDKFKSLIPSKSDK